MESNIRPNSNGEHLNTFSPRNAERVVYLCFAVLLSVIVLGAAAGGILDLARNRGQLNAREIEKLLLGVSFCALIGGLALLLLRGSQRIRNLRIMVFDDRVEEVVGKHRTVLNWDEIVEIRHIVHHTSFKIVLLHGGRATMLMSNDGRFIMLSGNLLRFSKLLAVVEQRTLLHMLNMAIEEYEEDSVEFGPISVSPEGVIASKALVPWDRQPVIKRDRCFVTVLASRGKQRQEFAIDLVPNVHVLAHLVKIAAESGHDSE